VSTPAAARTVQRPSHVRRDGLVTRLVAALDVGAVVVTAGPGYGKTTAVTDALAHAGRPAGWVRCRPGDRDPARLVLAVIAALRAAVPGAVDVLEERLLAGGGPVDATAAQRRLLQELEGLLVEPVVLVIDDAEVLAGAGAALGVVQELIDPGVPLLRVVLLSRVEPELRLGKARARGRVARFDERDLAFDAEETRAFVVARTGEEPTPAEVERRLTATRGWPLGVVLGLAGDASRTRADPGTPLHDFFLEEVLDHLPADTRSELLDAALADPPAGPPPAAVELAPFVHDAPGPPGGWTLHPLFAEFLVVRGACERSPAQQREAWRRVAGSLAEAGRSGEAVDAWIAAGAWSQARNELERDPPRLLRTPPDALAGWARALAGGVPGEPVAGLLSGLVLLADGELDGAVPALQAAAAAYRARGMAAADWTARAPLAEALYHTRRFAELGALRVADGPEDGGPAAAGLRDVRGVVQAWSAMGLGAQGRLDESRAAMGAARRGGASITPELEALHALYVEDPAGAIDEAVATIDRAIRRADGEGALPRAAYLGLQAAALHVSAGRLDDALAAVHEARRALERDPFVPFMRRSVGAIHGLVLAGLGRLDEAEVELGRVERRGAQDHGEAWIRLAHGLVAAGRGRRRDAVAEAEGALRALEGAAVQFRQMGGVVALRVLVAAGARDRARAVVGELMADVDARLPGPGGRFYRARLLALRACAHAEAGDLGAARSDLAVALADGGPAAHHVVRVAWDRLAPSLGDLLDDPAIDPGPLLAAVEHAFPGGEALLPLAGHPAQRVRATVAAAVVGSGHPAAPARARALLADPDPDVAATARAAQAALRTAGRGGPPLSFRVLGGFALHRGEWPVDEAAWERPMAARLVRFLLVHRGSAVPDDVLLEAFWPDRPERAGRASLQVAVSRARAVLDPPGAPASAIAGGGRTYRLALREGDRVDADVFAIAAREALRAPADERPSALETAAALWTGTPLPEDRYADWSRGWRQQLEERYRQVLSGLVDARGDGGDHDGAVEAGLRLLELDPADEGAHQRLIAAYARAGRRGHALRQFLACRHELVERLGVEPTARTVELQRRVLAGSAV
jgi:ATP/maltotriose-dependent transcriptional regulator MalT/DNA-binding SARP family transcriptional activator